MLSKALSLAIAVIVVHAVAGKISETYMGFAQIASSRLIEVISATL